MRGGGRVVHTVQSWRVNSQSYIITQYKPLGAENWKIFEIVKRVFISTVIDHDSKYRRDNKDEIGLCDSCYFIEVCLDMMSKINA